MQSRTVLVTNPLGMHARAAAHGTDITITAEGPDELQAVDALSALVERGFEEESGA